jgi:hypothetical protein
MKSPSLVRFGLALATAAVGVAMLAPAASASSPHTRPASLHIPSSTNYIYVEYDILGSNSYTMHDQASGITTSGWTVALFGQAFPYTSPPVHIKTLVLTPNKSGVVAYSFTVAPVIATKYTQKLYKNNVPQTTFSAGTVYVVQGKQQTITSLSCVGYRCKGTIVVHRFIPASAAKTELAKKFYDYLGVSTSTTKNPPPPKFMTLRTSGWTQSATTGVNGNAHEYQTTFTFTFTINAPYYSYAVDECTKDSESVDGIGLPGTHGCGNAQVPPNPTYLG